VNGDENMYVINQIQSGMFNIQKCLGADRGMSNVCDLMEEHISM
jgi:hypothetical protein